MKSTKSILILLSLFLIFSWEDNSVEPVVCDEGLTNVDGVCQLCGEGYTEIDSLCYYQSDLDVLQDLIDLNETSKQTANGDIYNSGNFRKFWFQMGIYIYIINDLFLISPLNQ